MKLELFFFSFISKGKVWVGAASTYVHLHRLLYGWHWICQNFSTISLSAQHLVESTNQAELVCDEQAQVRQIYQETDSYKVKWNLKRQINYSGKTSGFEISFHEPNNVRKVTQTLQHRCGFSNESSWWKL